MNSNRRQFLSAMTLPLLSSIAPAAALYERAPVPSISGLVRKSTMKLGMVTHNLAKDWDISTIIANCSEAQFEGVELRATHRHGVEVELSKKERAEVKQRFADSPVQLASLGSAFDYHTPDQGKLRKDVAATKDYIVLAQDVGARGVKVRPNALPQMVPTARTLEQIGRSLGELGEFAERHGQRIYVEVHGKGTALLPNIQSIIEVANHPCVGVCWNSNPSDLSGAGFDANFELVQHKIFTVHLHDLFDEAYPYRRLLARLQAAGFNGFCFAEIPASADSVRLMKYYRSLWLAYQNLP